MSAPAAIPGWAAEDHAAALRCYAATADLLPPAWPRPGAADHDDPRGFFERRFRADPAPPGHPGLFTGYYEPELEGALVPDARFRHPLHAPPPDLGAAPWHDRAAIEEGGLLAGCELVWLDSAVEAFLAQVQGSARVRLREGGVLRLGFAARNGHPYRSIGAELIRRGAVPAAGMSAQAIRDWCAAHPGEVAALLRHNPSYVFFRRLDLPPGSGPLGAMGRPVTALRSLAVDPAQVPLGAPVWVDLAGTEPFSRLMVAQDTGSAIRGAQRGDIFFGSGAAAGAAAGRLAAPGRLVALRPRGAAA